METEDTGALGSGDFPIFQISTAHCLHSPQFLLPSVLSVPPVPQSPFPSCSVFTVPSLPVANYDNKDIIESIP